MCTVSVHMNQNLLETLILLELAVCEFESKLRTYIWHWLNWQRKLWKLQLTL